MNQSECRRNTTSGEGRVRVVIRTVATTALSPRTRHLLATGSTCYIGPVGVNTAQLLSVGGNPLRKY